MKINKYLIRDHCVELNTSNINLYVTDVLSHKCHAHKYYTCCHITYNWYINSYMNYGITFQSIAIVSPLKLFVAFVNSWIVQKCSKNYLNAKKNVRSRKWLNEIKCFLGVCHYEVLGHMSPLIITVCSWMNYRLLVCSALDNDIFCVVMLCFFLFSVILSSRWCFSIQMHPLAS